MSSDLGTFLFYVVFHELTISRAYNYRNNFQINILKTTSFCKSYLYANMYLFVCKGLNELKTLEKYWSLQDDNSNRKVHHNICFRRKEEFKCVLYDQILINFWSINKTDNLISLEHACSVQKLKLMQLDNVSSSREWTIFHVFNVVFCKIVFFYCFLNTAFYDSWV